MTVGITDHRLLVNGCLEPLVRGVYTEFGKPSKETRAKVKAIMDRLEMYWVDGGVQHKKEAVAGKEVYINDYLSFVETPESPLVIAGLYEELHRILQDQPVKPHLYQRLGLAFRAIGIEPSEDLADAIHVATIRGDPSGVGFMTWSAIRDRESSVSALERYLGRGE